MKIKKILIPIIMGTAMFAVGCNQSTPKSEDVNFIKDVEKALESRFDYVSKVESGKIEMPSEPIYLKECINKELVVIEKYEDAEFEDATLRKLMLDYIDALNIQLDAVKHYTADYSKYDEMWTEGFNDRSVVIVDLVEDYGLRVDDEQLDILKDNAQIVESEKNVKEEIESMVNNIVFNKDQEEYGYKDYSAIVENTTSMNFDDFYLDIKLIDADGITVDTTTCGAENWNSGDKVKFDFSTDKDFEKIELEYEYYN